MRLTDLVQMLKLESLTPEVPVDPACEIAHGYASDLLSDVLAHAPRGGILVTVQVHMNVLAVSLHAELAAVIFSSARRPEDAVRAKAVEEGIHLFVSQESTFDVAGKLFSLGLRGSCE